MAGLFQVLWGGEKGFAKAKPLCGTDGSPLLLPGSQELVRICTRPFAADLDGDEKLDIVSGNDSGLFVLDLSVGDNVTLYHAAEGVSESVAKEKLAAWREAVKALDEKKLAGQYEQLKKERDAFVREDRTGFVWVYYGR